MVRQHEDYDMEDDINKLKIDIALLQKDLSIISKNVEETNESLKNIKSYFLKILFGVFGVVATYFVRWILSGGLANFGG